MESGIWNLAQTSLNNLKSHEAQPSEISNFSVVFESQIPNTKDSEKSVVFESNTIDFESNSTDFEWMIWVESGVIIRRYYRFCDTERIPT